MTARAETPSPDAATQAGERRAPATRRRTPRALDPTVDVPPPGTLEPTIDVQPVQRSVTSELGIDDDEQAEVVDLHSADISVLESGRPKSANQRPISGLAGGSTADGGRGLGRYEVLDEIARGGMGAIMTARDRDLKRTVAMKVLLGVNQESLRKPEARRRVRRFVAEAQITGQLEHPNIVPVHELGVDANGRPWFTMKLIDGEELSLLIDNLRYEVENRFTTEPVPVWRGRLLEVFAKVCDAVSYAHSRGVIHRDLKPDNIMVGAFGDVLLMDWGIARARSAPASDAGDAGDEPVQLDGPPEARLTRDGTIVGTPIYMSPEQALGQTKLIDERSDVYSLGAILYQILTLTPPYEGDSDAVLKRVQSKRPAAPPRHRAPQYQIPPELEAICRTAMQPELRRRYQSVEALRDDLRRFQSGWSVSVYQDTRLQRAAKWVRRNPIVTTAGAAGLLVAVFLGITLVQTINAQRANEDRMQQEAQRVAAESQQREELLRRLAAEERFDELQDVVGSAARNQRDAVREEYNRLWNARPAGQYAAVFVSALGPERVDRFIAAFRRVLDVGDAVRQREAYYDFNDTFYLAMLLDLGRDDLATAIRYYTRSLESNPAYLPALLNRASCHARMGHFTDALGDVRRAMDLQPRDAAVWHTRGMIYREQGDLPAALADFNESLRIDPDSANTLNVRGGVLLDMNQVDDALRDFNRAISLNSCDGFYNRARVRNRLNDLAGAMSDYADCIAREPWQSGAWNNRGLLRRKTGDLPGAIADFRQALRCAPDKWDAKANLGHTLAHTGVPSDRTEGVQLLQDAWRMCPDSAARTRIATLIRDAGGDVPE